MNKKISFLLIAVLLCLPLMQIRPVEAQAASQLLITEIQIGVGYERNEFVEVYNTSSSPMVVQNLRIEYLSSSFSGGLSSQTRLLGIYSGIIPGQGMLLLRNDMYVSAPVEIQAADIVFGSPTDNPTTGFLAYSGGYVRIVDDSIADTPQLVDCVRWGGSDGTTLAGCQRTPSAHTSDQNSLQRPFINSQYHLSNGIVVANMTPRQLLNTIEEPEPEPEPEPDPEPAPLNCLAVSINEILPNPAGSDTGYEYIELYNQTSSSVDLTGCILKVGSSQQVLSGLIEPGGYRVFYGLSLPNAAGGTVSFGTADNMTSVSYPANLGDDEAYGVLGGVWQSGLSPTPGAANAEPLSLPGGSSTGSNDGGLKPCLPGKYRNPETNRCRNVETASSLTPCRAGQVRNPETNRCRMATASTSTLTPCRVGQVRNPETNRCRKVGADGSTLKPCAAGQERNPETNRCRKVASAKSTNPMANPAKATSKPVSYYVLGVVAALALLYAAYEYRHNIRQLFVKLRRRT